MGVLGCHPFWSHCGLRLLLLLLGVLLPGLALPPIRYSHAGICPNDMNPNLWVDAQSTCKRECEADQVSRGSEPGMCDRKQAQTPCLCPPGCSGTQAPSTPR